jgi:multimeric flavodoxin WrbA
MRIIGINGSPRKTNNSSTLLEHALKGASLDGAETETVHLYELDYRGCYSCFQCKLRDGPSYGRCAIRDDLRGLFEKIEVCDGLILASPIYFRSVSGEMTSFLERLLYQYLPYTKSPQPLFGRRIRTAFLYTMNNTEEEMAKHGFASHLQVMEGYLKLVFGHVESLCSWDTWQFDDYSKYVADKFDPEKKKRIRETVFPADCRKAFELGRRTASPA